MIHAMTPSKLNVSERKFPFVSPNSIIREREGSSPGSRGRGVVVVHDNYAGGREGEGRAFVLTSRRVVLHKVLSRTFFPELMVLRLQFGDDRGESCLLSFRGYQGNRLRARNPHNPSHQPGSRRARTHRLLPRCFGSRGLGSRGEHQHHVPSLKYDLRRENLVVTTETTKS